MRCSVKTKAGRFEKVSLAEVMQRLGLNPKPKNVEKQRRKEEPYTLVNGERVVFDPEARKSRGTNL
jgi:hypothetical protein